MHTIKLVLEEKTEEEPEKTLTIGIFKPMSYHDMMQLTDQIKAYVTSERSAGSPIRYNRRA